MMLAATHLKEHSVPWAALPKDPARWFVVGAGLWWLDLGTRLAHFALRLPTELSKNYSWQAELFCHQPMFTWPHGPKGPASLWLHLEDGLYEYDGATLRRHTLE